MDVLEVAPGPWRWTGYHEEWKEDVGSVLYATSDGVVLVDPIVPPEDTDRFWRALDRDVERSGGEVHVLVTIFWNARSNPEIVSRCRARVWKTSRGRAAVVRRRAP
jgi:hypothetical protein